MHSIRRLILSLFWQWIFFQHHRIHWSEDPSHHFQVATARSPEPGKWRLSDGGQRPR